MISKYDILKLQDLPIEQVAEALNLTVKHHKALCPFHADSRPSLTFNVRKNKYRCFVCDARGGVIDLVMHTQGWNFYDSCMWLSNQFGIIISDERDYKPQQVRPQTVKCKVSSESEVKPDIPYLERLMSQPIINELAAKFLFDERKISMNVVRKLGLSSIAYNCPMSSSPKPTYFDGPALLIPYRDIDGNLISVQSRYLGTEDKPRFRFPKGITCHIYNLPVLKTMKIGNPLFVTEGVTDCLAMLSAGFDAIAIPSATLLKPEDAELIKGLNIHIYPDQDAPGERLYLDLKAICPNVVRHQLPAGFKDVGQYYSFIHKND